MGLEVRPVIQLDTRRLEKDGKFKIWLPCSESSKLSQGTWRELESPERGWGSGWNPPERGWGRDLSMALLPGIHDALGSNHTHTHTDTRTHITIPKSVFPQYVPLKLGKTKSTLL